MATLKAKLARPMNGLALQPEETTWIVRTISKLTGTAATKNLTWTLDSTVGANRTPNHGHQQTSPQSPRQAEGSHLA